MERVEVAVVGGGPAGSSAARAAAEGGAETRLFEKGVPREDRAGIGPDSTDAAGILDYWVDLMDLDGGFPEDLIYQTLEGAEFIGPSERVMLNETGIDASYPHFGFTYDRAGFDDYLLDRAATAGAECEVGTSVRGVETRFDGPPVHELTLDDGSTIVADRLILADGPQRTVTRGVLDRFLPQGRGSVLDATRANHIAYQEYRRFPDALVEDSVIKFWWGHMPGHTAYPWVFPNEDGIMRVGLTMPIGIDLSEVENREAYALLHEDDEQVPDGGEYIERLLRVAYPDYDLEDFPLVEDRGKREGTETYPISSTRPIDSPVGADVAVTGGAMGATSAFHEGGGHLAVRTGSIAGELAAADSLHRYNEEWKRALGAEVLRNVSLAELVRGFGPADWDRIFRVANRALSEGEDVLSMFDRPFSVGLDSLRFSAAYRFWKYRYRDGRFVQLRESEYAYDG